MAKRSGKRRDEGIKKLLAEQQASGLSVSAFARERGLPRWKLHEGRQRLRKRKSRAKDADFIQVHVRPVEPAASPIEVELKVGRRVHVPPGFDEDELHRLSGIFKCHGVDLPKQTMWDMLVKVDELVAQPILRQMQQELLASGVSHADETSVPVSSEGEKGSRKGYIWSWRAPGGDESDKSLVQFTLTRARHGPKNMLGADRAETLITDGYSGYDEVVRENGIVRAGCWAHARRRFKDAMKLGSKDAARVFVHLQRLFWIERSMKKLIQSRDQKNKELLALRLDLRARLSRKDIERTYAAAGEVDAMPSTLPKSKLGKALGYLFNQEGELAVFLMDPRIEIHNNDAGRDLRHVVVSRNNWMVFASQRGGEVASRLYSIVLSCKHAGDDPEAYIEDVLVRVSSTPASEVASLTPWAWASSPATVSEN